MPKLYEYLGIMERRIRSEQNGETGNHHTENQELNMYLRVKQASYVPRYKVDIEFNDGRRRIVDFGPFLKKAQNPMFTKYRRLNQFKSFRIEHGDLMWGDFEMIFPIEDLHRGEI